MQEHRQPIIEACTGLLDGHDPETCLRLEAEQELGYRLLDVKKVYDIFMSPGSVTERLSFFVAEYSPADRVSGGGGDPSEGEDIAVLAMPLAKAMELVESGRIIDAKTVLLIQFAALKGLVMPAQRI